MPQYVISEVWSELKRYINTVDRAEAAEVLVSVMVDHDVDPDEIKSAFKGDADIKKALADYINNDTEEYEEDEEEEYDEDEYYDEDE